MNGSGAEDTRIAHAAGRRFRRSGAVGRPKPKKKGHAGACRTRPEQTGSSQKKELLPLFCVPVSVDRREAIPLFGKIFERENSGHRANGDASATIDAFWRVGVELGLSLESRLILTGVETVYRTDIDACRVVC